MTPKTKQLWKISKEQQEKFITELDKNCILMNWDLLDIRELFKMIRSAEYRRGKEENKK